MRIKLLKVIIEQEEDRQSATVARSIPLKGIPIEDFIGKQLLTLDQMLSVVGILLSIGLVGKDPMSLRKTILRSKALLGRDETP